MTIKSARRIRYRGRLFLGPVLLDEFSSHKIVRVLRLGPGATVSVVDDDGTEALCRIVAIDAEGVKVHPEPNVTTATAETLIPATIAIALIKNERMDEAIEKACEFGVRSIQPFIADFSSRRLITADRVERWRRIASTAALQSGGRRETEILPPRSGVEELLEPSTENSPSSAPCHRVKRQNPSGIWYLHSTGQPIGPLLASISSVSMILVGPEGGWSDKELTTLEARSIKAISLGNRTLRAETAVTIAAFLAFQFNKISINP